MNVKDTINCIIHIPEKYDDLENASPISLLKECGYIENHNQIKENDIQEMLIQHPDCINKWIQWFEDKRSEGWYFYRSDTGKYIVGSHSPDAAGYYSHSYSDGATACAAYIMKEVEHIWYYYEKKIE